MRDGQVFVSGNIFLEFRVFLKDKFTQLAIGPSVIQHGEIGIALFISR